ncbi:MAG: redox-regulated ATPase YchF [Candidatus Auribacterota bacterium]|nr:redox-regulated ATPase YchF [Candidatus Auribacterota bacterium]
MAIQAGMVGLPQCGKTTIYNAITGAAASGFGAAEMNRAIINVPDNRIEPLVELYHPEKTIYATLEVVDIPGLQLGSTSEGGRGNRLLGHIKDVNALLHVVRCFESGGPIDPEGDVEIIDLEMVTADLQTIENKINRLVKKSRSGDKEAIREMELCREVHNALEAGIPARKQGLSEAELKAVADCHLASIKPILYIANLGSMDDAEEEPTKKLRELAKEEGAEMIVVAGRDEADLIELDEDDRQLFMDELGITESSMARLIRATYRLLGLISFFTTGEDEVHAWTCRDGAPAPVAAGKIHSDMESGFIRMEVIQYPDLIELGSEEAVARAGKTRLEGKDYLVRDGDIVVVRFSK